MEDDTECNLDERAAVVLAAAEQMSQQHGEMLSLLRELEWAGIERSGPSCPRCGATKLSEPHVSTHFSDCDLDVILTKLGRAEPKASKNSGKSGI